MTKTQAISTMIIEAMQANGGDIASAIDSVLGQGAYLKMAAEIYEALRAA